MSPLRTSSASPAGPWLSSHSLNVSSTRKFSVDLNAPPASRPTPRCKSLTTRMWSYLAIGADPNQIDGLLSSGEPGPAGEGAVEHAGGVELVAGGEPLRKPRIEIVDLLRGEGVKLPPVRAGPQRPQRVLVGREQLGASVAAVEDDELDHQRVAPVHRCQWCVGGGDEAQRDRGGVVDAAVGAVALGHGEDGVHRSARRL